jgi:hypothetical protein
MIDYYGRAVRKSFEDRLTGLLRASEGAGRTRVGVC